MNRIFLTTLCLLGLGATVLPVRAAPVLGWTAGGSGGMVYARDPESRIDGAPIALGYSTTPRAPDPVAASAATSAGGYGSVAAFGGSIKNSAGVAEPVVQALAQARYKGPADRDGRAYSFASAGLTDMITLQSNTLAIGAAVTVPFMLMPHGEFDMWDPAGGGGPISYLKHYGNTASMNYSSLLGLWNPKNIAQGPLLRLSMSNSTERGYGCGLLVGQQNQYAPCQFAQIPVGDPSATEECFSGYGCFVVGTQPSTLGIVFVMGELDARIGDTLELVAGGSAQVGWTEDEAFGVVGADMSSTGHFGFVNLPDGVSIKSALGLNYGFDPVRYVDSRIGNVDPGPDGHVPEPAGLALVLLGLAMLWACARRRAHPLACRSGVCSTSV